jgi:hypothetical protein
VKLPNFARRYSKEGACLIAGCALGYLIGASGGRWVSTGNGRTIVNTRTGEIRSSFTGEPLVESSVSQLDIEERARLESAAAKGEESLDRTLAQFQERRRRLGLPPLEISNEDRALWLIDAPSANGGTRRIVYDNDWNAFPPVKPSTPKAQTRTMTEADFWAMGTSQTTAEGHQETISRNAELFKQLQQFVASHPTIIINGFNVAWEHHTKAFRVADHLGSYQREQLLDILGKAIVDERYRADKSIQQAIDALKEYHPTVHSSVSP